MPFPFSWSCWDLWSSSFGTLKVKGYLLLVLVAMSGPYLLLLSEGTGSSGTWVWSLVNWKGVFPSYKRLTWGTFFLFFLPVVHGRVIWFTCTLHMHTAHCTVLEIAKSVAHNNTGWCNEWCKINWINKALGSEDNRKQVTCICHLFVSMHTCLLCRSLFWYDICMYLIMRGSIYIYIQGVSHNFGNQYMQL